MVSCVPFLLALSVSLSLSARQFPNKSIAFKEPNEMSGWRNPERESTEYELSNMRPSGQEQRFHLDMIRVMDISEK